MAYTDSIVIFMCRNQFSKLTHLAFSTEQRHFTIRIYRRDTG
jgi:hypothetical protein